MGRERQEVELSDPRAVAFLAPDREAGEPQLSSHFVETHTPEVLRAIWGLHAPFKRRLFE